jgi:allantoinase
MSAAPATFAGISGRKGQIATGYDADLLVFDPDAKITVEPDRLFFRHKVSPYVGRELEGLVQHTVLRGKCVYDGRQHSEGPLGRHLLHRRTAS